MVIIPALYLLGGEVVSHYKGERDQTTILSRDPLACARQFEKQGAQFLHLVDLNTEDRGQKMAQQIARHTALQISYAGRLAEISLIRDLLEQGIFKVSLTQENEALAADALQEFGSQKICFTILAKRNFVEGKPNIEVVDYGKDLAEKGFEEIIFHDKNTEGTFHPNFDEADRLVLATSSKIYAFGGVGSMSDLEVFKNTGVAGVMVSRALFEGKISLRECLEFFLD
ncbi:MAG: HisA/HisF-related TIM barrel protein [Patescibacteria group bacterium]